MKTVKDRCKMSVRLSCFYWPFFASARISNLRYRQTTGGCPLMFFEWTRLISKLAGSFIVTDIVVTFQRVQ